MNDPSARPFFVETSRACLCQSCGCDGVSSEASEQIPRCSPCLMGICEPVTFAMADAADIAWSKELRAVYGNRTGDVRYTSAGCGDPGSAIRHAHDRWMEIMKRWRNVMERNRKMTRRGKEYLGVAGYTDKELSRAKRLTVAQLEARPDMFGPHYPRHHAEEYLNKVKLEMMRRRPSADGGSTLDSGEQQ